MAVEVTTYRDRLAVVARKDDFSVTRETLDRPHEMGLYGGRYVAYRLHGRPRGVPEVIGDLQLLIDHERHIAVVYSAEIDEGFRGVGLGKFLYKVAINDLVAQGYAVRSDTARSPQAEGVWRSIWRSNPGAVREMEYPSVPGIRPSTAYEATRPVLRRPVQAYRRGALRRR